SEISHKMASSLSHCSWFVAEYDTDEVQSVALGHIGIGIFNQKAQPLWNSEHTVALVMAGGFYNQEAMTKEIGQNTQTDEQIALALYQQYGEDFASRLQGIFIIAIWDKEQ